jgi:hypothetical protein
MSQSVIFEFGAVVFVAVTAAVLLFGMSVFQEWQDRDDIRADIGHEVDTPSDGSTAITPHETRKETVPLDRASSPGSVRPRSAA